MQLLNSKFFTSTKSNIFVMLGCRYHINIHLYKDRNRGTTWFNNLPEETLLTGQGIRTKMSLTSLVAKLRWRYLWLLFVPLSVDINTLIYWNFYNYKMLPQISLRTDSWCTYCLMFPKNNSVYWTTLLSCILERGCTTYAHIINIPIHN